MAGGCAAAPVATPWIVELEFTVDLAGYTRRLSFCADGSAELTGARVVGSGEEVDAPRRWPPSAERALLVAELGRDAATLPRYAYTPSASAGVSVRLRVLGPDAEHRFEGFNFPATPLMTFARGLLVTKPLPADARELEELVALQRFTGQRAISWTPGRSQASELAPLLLPGQPDLRLRRFAARIAVVERTTELLPALRAAFVESQRNDPAGDYFLALAMLGLGDHSGVPRIATAACGRSQAYAAEAGAALTAAFGSVVPEWDGGGPDPRPAAVAEFLAWYRDHRAELCFDRTTGVYAPRPR
jgi:hypothetical protein